MRFNDKNGGGFCPLATLSNAEDPCCSPNGHRERESKAGCIAQRLIADTATLAVSCAISSQQSSVAREDIKLFQQVLLSPQHTNKATSSVTSAERCFSAFPFNTNESAITPCHYNIRMCQIIKIYKSEARNQIICI